MKAGEYIRAVRALPGRFVSDLTELTPLPAASGLARLTGCLFVFHPHHETLVWKRGSELWVAISKAGRL